MRVVFSTLQRGQLGPCKSMISLSYRPSRAFQDLALLPPLPLPRPLPALRPGGEESATEPMLCNLGCSTPVPANTESLASSSCPAGFDPWSRGKIDFSELVLCTWNMHHDPGQGLQSPIPVGTDPGRSSSLALELAVAFLPSLHTSSIAPELPLWGTAAWLSQEGSLQGGQVLCARGTASRLPVFTGPGRSGMFLLLGL